MSLFPGPEAVVAPEAPDTRPAHRTILVAPPGFGGKPWWRPDAVALLTFYAGLLLLLPARLVVKSMGGVGRPSLLFGLGLLGLWGISRVVPYLTTRGTNPMRRILMAYGVVFLLTYGLGYARRLPAAEALSSDRALLAAASLLGVALTITDGILTREQLDKLLRRVVTFGSIAALVAFLQFAFGIDLVAMIKIPGMRLNGVLYSIGARGGPGFRRVSGTSAHAIEFSVVMSMLLPIAIHYAIHARDRGDRTLRYAQVAIMLLGVAFAISRSGVLAMFAAFLVLGWAWAPHVKARGLVLFIAALAVLRAAVPGLIGTFRSLFLSAPTDPSVTGRTSDYEIVSYYIHDRPWFGRGPGTFMPSRYIILDNQLLGTLVSTGVVGLCALLALYLMGMSVARRVTRRGASDNSRHLAQALMATLAAALLVTVTFDALAFAQYAGLLFLVLGSIGALWRLERLGDTARDRRRAKPIIKRWRSLRHPAPHPLQRAFPGLSDHLRWRRSRPV